MPSPTASQERDESDVSPDREVSKKPASQRHCEDELEAVTSVVDPLMASSVHHWHPVEFWAVLNFPTSQASHWEDAMVEVEPAGHASQEDLSSEEKKPAGQGSQKLAPSGSLLMNPSLQGSHINAPGKLYVPG